MSKVGRRKRAALDELPIQVADCSSRSSNDDSCPPRRTPSALRERGARRVPVNWAPPTDEIDAQIALRARRVVENDATTGRPPAVTTAALLKANSPRQRLTSARTLNLRRVRRRSCGRRGSSSPGWSSMTPGAISSRPACARTGADGSG